MEKEKVEVSPEQWINWGWIILSGVVAGIIFLYSNFQTVSSFNSYKEDQIELSQTVVKRLDRIENKLDEVLHVTRSRH